MITIKNNNNISKPLGGLQNPFRLVALATLLFLVQASNAQTIGATFGVYSGSSGATLIQSIGQPFSVFEKMEESGKGNNPLQMNQGHILPMEIYSGVSKKLTFKAYPNPVKDILNLSLDNASVIKGIMVMDMNGRVIKNYMSVNSNHAEIDMQEFAAGVYLINATDDTGNRGFVKVTKIGQLIN